MLQIFKYSSEDLPEYLKKQITSSLNGEWPNRSLKSEAQQGLEVIKKYNPIHFVLTVDDNVISYAAVVRRILNHNNKLYKTYGLSGVFTVPEFRNKGYALKILKEAKDFIEKTDADIVLFQSRLKNFYEKIGFICLDKARLFKGNPKNLTRVNENVFMLFISNKGKLGKKDFETKPIYFGEDMW